MAAELPCILIISKLEADILDLYFLVTYFKTMTSWHLWGLTRSCPCLLLDTINESHPSHKCYQPWYNLHHKHPNVGCSCVTATLQRNHFKHSFKCDSLLDVYVPKLLHSSTKQSCPEVPDPLGQISVWRPLMTFMGRDHVKGDCGREKWGSVGILWD